MKNRVRNMICVACCFILFNSCQKDDIQDIVLPHWLIESIKADEAYILQHPSTMKAYGTWTRTTWVEEYYYEYSNPLSSSLSRPISHNNDTLTEYVGEFDTPYNKEKCCEVVVWKGSAVDD